MKLTPDETEHVLKLTTFAAKSIITESSKEIFSRVNDINADLLSRIDKTVAVLSETNIKLAETAERVSAIANGIHPTAKIIVQDEITKCRDRHDNEARSDRSIYIAISALVLSLGQLAVKAFEMF